MMLLIRPTHVTVATKKRITLLKFFTVVPRVMIGAGFHILFSEGGAVVLSGIALAITAFFYYKGDVHAIYVLVKTYAAMFGLLVMACVNFLRAFLRSRKEY